MYITKRRDREQSLVGHRRKRYGEERVYFRIEHSKNEAVIMTNDGDNCRFVSSASSPC